MNVKKLNEIVRKSGKTKKTIASESNISKVTLDNALQGGDIRVSILESIAHAMGVRVGDLFDDGDTSTTQTMTTVNQSGGNNTQNVGQSPDVETLRKQIEEKDRQIARLLDIIQATGK